MNGQHDLTPRIYVLHKIMIVLKFMSYINQKVRPSYQTALNLCLTYIENFGKKCARKSGATGNWQLAGITDTERGINIFQFFFVY